MLGIHDNNVSLNKTLNKAVEKHLDAIRILEKKAKNWVQTQNTYEILWKLNLSFAWGHASINRAENYEQEAFSMTSSFDDYIEMADLFIKKTDTFILYPDDQEIPFKVANAKHCLNKASIMTDGDNDKIMRVKQLSDRLDESQ